MLYEAIDSVFLAVPDLDAACRPYEALGLRLSPARAGLRSLQVGEPGNLFAVHFLADAGREQQFPGPLRAALAAGRVLFAVVLRVGDLGVVLDRLAGAGIRSARLPATAESDAVAWLPLDDQAGTDLVLVQRAGSAADRHAAAGHAGLLAHSFPLKRFDHLAAITPDLEAKTRFWMDVLSLPVAGEVTTPAIVIRQLRIGDAVLELLGPASPDSPVRKRPAGLVGMISWEVRDLDAAVRQARAAGFTVADPAAGPLPETRIATVDGSALAGVNMQLLQYVRSDPSH